MLQGNRKKAILFVGMAAFVAATILAFKPAEKQQGPKNLQILPKDIPHEKLHEIMEGFNHALGVKCNFCHAPSKDTAQHYPDFASDDKMEKNAARHMMKMTADINAKYFNWMGSTMPDTIHVVTCATCHHGSPHPEGKMGGDDDDHKGPGGQPGPPPPPPAKQ